MADSNHAATSPHSSLENGVSRAQPRECASTDFYQG